MLPIAPLLVKALLLTTYTVNRLTIHNNVVQLSHGGKVRGTILRSEEGRQFYAFKGIPYAEPPVGELRFKAPVAKKAWTQEVDGTKEGPECAQVDLFLRPGTFLGQEDCLKLNVYTPQLPHRGKTIRKRDVLVYIHSGGFMIGSGTTYFVPPERIMDNGNVFVVLNYRLDALGFLSTGDEASPGNYGLLDQSLALQWVKDNIEAFGGDPGSVSIFGHSAGGASVSYHLISPLSKGLFHRAMPMSGSSLSPWAFERTPLRWANYLASQIECPVETSVAMVECLRTKPVEDLVKGMLNYGKMLSFPLLFVPTLDGMFIDASPYEIYSSHSDRINKVPVLTGVTEEEGSVFFGWAKLLKPNVSITSDEFITFSLNTSLSGQSTDIMEEIKLRYLQTAINEEEDNYIKAMIKVLSDGQFKMDHYLEVKALATAGVPVYAYSYEFSSNTLNSLFGVSRKYGVTHGEDIHMYFDINWMSKAHFTERERKMSKFLMKILSNFAKTGKPDPTHQYHVPWEPSEPTQIHILKINETLSTEDYSTDHPDQRFWLAVKEKVREYVNSGQSTGSSAS